MTDNSTGHAVPDEGAASPRPAIPSAVLGRYARRVIAERGVNMPDFLTHVYGPNHGGEWHGDRCGCPDDRCRDGFHHDGGDEDCGCLPAVLDQQLGQGVWADVR